MSIERWPQRSREIELALEDFEHKALKLVKENSADEIVSEWLETIEDRITDVVQRAIENVLEGDYFQRMMDEVIKASMEEWRSNEQG